MPTSLIPSSNIPVAYDDEYLALAAEFAAEDAKKLKVVSNLPPFKRLKMPKQGGKQFDMAMPSGPVMQFPFFIGQILHLHNFRQLWQGPAVACQSDDGVTARPSRVMFPNQRCELCPKSQFSKDVTGRNVKPECSSKTRIFMLPMMFNPTDVANKTWEYGYIDNNGVTQFKHENLSEPVYLDVPPTSNKSIQELMNACDGLVPGQRGSPRLTIALFECQEVRSAGGIVYAKLVIRPLTAVNRLGIRVRKEIMDKYDIENIAIAEGDPEEPGAPAAVTSQAPVFVHPSAQPAVAPSGDFTGGAAPTTVATPIQQQPPATPPVANTSALPEWLVKK